MRDKRWRELGFVKWSTMASVMRLNPWLLSNFPHNNKINSSKYSYLFYCSFQRVCCSVTFWTNWSLATRIPNFCSVNSMVNLKLIWFNCDPIPTGHHVRTKCPTLLARIAPKNFCWLTSWILDASIVKLRGRLKQPLKTEFYLFNSKTPKSTYHFISPKFKWNSNFKKSITFLFKVEMRWL